MRDLDSIFSVYEACYTYAVAFHRGQFSRSYALLGKLEAKHFLPRLSVQTKGYRALDYLGKVTYKRLVAMDY